MSLKLLVENLAKDTLIVTKVDSLWFQQRLSFSPSTSILGFFTLHLALQGTHRLAKKPFNFVLAVFG